MKKNRLSTAIGQGLFGVCLLFLPVLGAGSEAKPTAPTAFAVPDDALDSQVLGILQAKCNTCHRKQNPFMVFNERNMKKRAPKIYKAVFVERRMPKGDKIRLTKNEYAQLEQWLIVQNTF